MEVELEGAGDRVDAVQHISGPWALLTQHGQNIPQRHNPSFGGGEGDRNRAAGSPEADEHHSSVLAGRARVNSPIVSTNRQKQRVCLAVARDER